MEASCWVARKIVRSVASASSSARTEPGRPILKATLVKGKITTSRMGTIGSRTMSTGVRSEYSSINQKCFSRTVEGTKGEPLLQAPLAPICKKDFRTFRDRSATRLRQKAKAARGRGKIEGG